MKIDDFGCTSIYGNPHLDDFYGCHHLDVGIMVIHRWISCFLVIINAPVTVAVSKP